MTYRRNRFSVPRTFSLCVALLFLVTQSPAQTNINNVRSWLVYFGDHMLSDRLGFHIDGQWREGADRRAGLFRPALNIYFKPNLFASAGYAYIVNHGDGNTVSEHRTYQQLQYVRRTKRAPYLHRFRLEQRHVEAPVHAKRWRYQNRFRYFARTEQPAFGKTADANGFYLALGNEIFLGFGPNKGESVYDQNRAYAALGYRLSNANKLEFGYLYQNVLQRDGKTREHNHVVQVMLLSSKCLM